MLSLFGLVSYNTSSNLLDFISFFQMHPRIRIGSGENILLPDGVDFLLQGDLGVFNPILFLQCKICSLQWQPAHSYKR